MSADARKTAMHDPSPDSASKAALIAIFYGGRGTDPMRSLHLRLFQSLAMDPDATAAPDDWIRPGQGRVDAPFRPTDRLADLNRVTPELLPAARADVLRVHDTTGQVVHESAPATVPSIGFVLERRFVQARDVNGTPVLWLQRQRTPFLSPPARAMRFDVLPERV